jgi:glycosyltransferase involved in cell wall biosynthesis
VIGSSSGEIPKVIAEAGLVFPEGDTEALAERIEAIRSTPALAADCARRGREKAEGEYSWTAIASRQAEVYRELMNEKSQIPNPAERDPAS